jgi:hypothetical protein
MTRDNDWAGPLPQKSNRFLVIIAAAFALLLAAGVGWAASNVLGDGGSPDSRDALVTEPTATAQPSATVMPTATAVPEATATSAPSISAEVLPDRTDCTAIRATGYQTDGERTWFLANCNLPVAPPTAALVSQPVAPTPVPVVTQAPAAAVAPTTAPECTYDVLVRVDFSFVTVTARRLCGIVPRGGEGQSMQATVYFSRLDSSLNDLSCRADYRNGFAVCTVPSLKVGVGSTVAVSAVLPVVGPTTTSFIAVH